MPEDDQGYLKRRRQEEMSHYALEASVTGKPSPYTRSSILTNMFPQRQVTLNMLVTSRTRSSPPIWSACGTSERRPARDGGPHHGHRERPPHAGPRAGPDVAAMDGGPITKITGLAGVPESVAPPNNNGYERTACWTKIEQAVAALTPFVDMTAAKSAGFDINRSFAFEPFTPKLPSPLGAFVNFKGC